MKAQNITARVVLVALAALSLIAPVEAGFTASIEATGNSATSGTSFVTATDYSRNYANANVCTSVPTGAVISATADFVCPGRVVPTQVNAGISVAETFEHKQSGTAPPASMTMQMKCAPVALANLAPNKSQTPLLPRYGLTTSTTGGPFGGADPGGAVTVDGVSGQAVDPNTAGAGGGGANPPSTFTMGIWFKTSVTGGGMMGFTSDSNDGAAISYDRLIYLDSSGNVNFGVFVGGTISLKSSGKNYADGAWHLAVGTDYFSGSQSGLLLFVDGQQTSVNPAWYGGATATYAGYWRIGSSPNTSGWGGSKNAFTGQLSNAFVLPFTIDTLQPRDLYTSGSQTNFSNILQSYPGNPPTNFWPLNDNGLSTFAGPFPGQSDSPCADIGMQAGTAGVCFYPAHAGVCDFDSTTYPALTTVVAALKIPLTTPAKGDSQWISMSFRRQASYRAYSRALQMLVTTTLEQTGFSQRFTWASIMKQ